MRYICTICGYIYDDDKEAVPFDQLPDDWVCPLCGSSKSDFEPMRAEPAPEKEHASERPKVVSDGNDRMYGMTIGQLAALCSNLAKGCEKQYKFEEQRMFMELSEYFDSISPAVDDATVEEIANRIETDIDENYKLVDYVGRADSDRGALRISVWGQKVTRMIDTLVDRYLGEGDEMLRGKEVWVCTTCGFIYIGERPPETCPVCKVPSWKFRKMEKEVKA